MASNKTFKVRSESVDEGRDYEKLWVAYLTVNLLKAENIKNFRISANNDDYGAFDDVILETESTNNEKTTYAIQLKHVTNDKDRRKLTISSLQQSEKGKYSVKKYFGSWKITLKNGPSKLILLTNLQFLLEHKEVDLDIFKAKIVRRETDSLINSAADCCFQFEIIHGSEKDNTSEEIIEDYNKFFQNFYIYADQAKCIKLRRAISDKFQKLFNCDKNHFENYMSFVNEWFNQRGSKSKLDRDWVKRSIALCLLLPQYIRPISSEQISEKGELLHRAISEFHVTVILEETYTKIDQVFGNCLTKLDVVKVNKFKKDCNLANINYIQEIKELKPHEKALLLWLMHECPLIVNEHPTIIEAIKLLPEYKFILITQNFENWNLENLLIFKKLSDLKKNPEIYEKITEDFYCSPQGKKAVQLKSLIEVDEELSSFVTTNDLLTIINHPLLIGESQEKLPDPHIKRKLSCTVINVEYLRQIDQEDQNVLIVISCNSNFDKIKKYLRNFTLVQVEAYLKNPSKGNTEKCIYYSEKECPQKNFDEICKRNKNMKQCHHFRLTGDGNLQWKKTIGLLGELEPFEVNSLSIEESELYSDQPGNNINVICANPGMGKSIMTKSLKNGLSSKFWTIIVHPTDISLYFQEGNNRDFEEYIEERESKEFKNFDKAVLKSFRKKRFIAYIWDGMDEIPDKNLERVLKIIDKLCSKGFLQWITARCHLQEKLEKKFKVFARTIRQFDDDQQDEYIRKRLRHVSDNFKIREVINKIKDNIKMIQCDEVLRIPLQIYMLTELFRQNLPKYSDLLNNIFSLADLYHHFVSEKINRFYEDKAQITTANDSLQQILNEYKASYLKKYEKAALKALFELEDYKKFNVNCDSFLQKIEKECDGFGLITEVSKDLQPTFLHNSYGEYFVASYFFRNYDKINNLRDIIFKERYSNIRFLFDLLMAEGYPVHIGVLYKNLEVLTNHEGHINVRDKGGRTPLHLACTWGQQYPLLNTKTSEEDEEIFLINDALGNSVVEENAKYKTIFDYLLQKCDHKDKDELFQMDSLSYADSALCLLPIVDILRKEKVDFKYFTNFKDICSVLYYAIKFDHSHVFDALSDIPFIKTQKRGLSLLHLCAEYNSVHCLEKLLSSEKYQQMVNIGDMYEIPPTRTACKKGYRAILQMLIDNGVDLSMNVLSLIEIACKNGHLEIVESLISMSQMNINADNRSIYSLMQIACRNGYDQIVKFLLDFGVNINAKINRNGTPLYIASQYGHEKIVEILLKANADINRSNKHGSSPLHISCQKNYTEIVKLLLQNQANVNAVDKKGFTPLHSVCKNGNKELVELLIGAEEINVNKPGLKNFTPLHHACQCGDPEIVKLLVEARANPNLSSRDGFTPIHVACEQGHPRVVKLLIDLKADINVSDIKGIRPLDLAIKKGFDEISQLLVQAGATCQQP